MNGASKKHHYVPQSMLRQFSVENKKSHVYVFDKINLRSFISSIRDAGSENQFNTVEIGEQTFCFEDVFQDHDAQVAYLLNKITTERSLANITLDDRSAILEMFATQIVRTKMTRTSMTSFAEQLAASQTGAGFDPGRVEGFKVPTDQEVRRTALLALLNLYVLIAPLESRQLVLITNYDSNPFWISDNPVVQHNGFPYGQLGLNEKGIEIYLPIARDLILGLWCPSIEIKLGQMLSSSRFLDNRSLFLAAYNGIQSGLPFSFGTETCRFFNSRQVFNSSRFLYAPDSKFTLANEILTYEPKIRDVQSLVTIGPMGIGCLAATNMPSGLWAVFYGKWNHHMVGVKNWNEGSPFLEFETASVNTMRSILLTPAERTRQRAEGQDRRARRPSCPLPSALCILSCSPGWSQ